jgi:hypothetical protein
MSALELGDAAEDVFESGRFVIGIDPDVDGLVGPVVRTTRLDHVAPSARDARGGL